jgi:sulfate/thiosulfate transport system substrate-binding protein
MGIREAGFGLTAIALVALAVLPVACGGGSEDSTGGVAGDEIYVVGYEGLDSAYERSLEPAFAGTLGGKGVDFENSFGDSSEQRESVMDDAPASVVHFERVGDIERLVDAGVVDADWDDEQFLFSGIPSWTVIVFVVRKGNPKHVRNLQDLLRDDVDVVVPNPFSSDTGRWGVMNAYATLIDEGDSEAEALAGVALLLEKAVSQPPSAAEGLAAFLRGQGDVLLAYESQAIRALEAGRSLRFVVPHKTIRVDTAVAVTGDAPKPVARHFLKFLWSGTGQMLWAKEGYRPADQWFQARFKERFVFRETLSIADFGGWAEVDEELFDEETGSVAIIEKELGVPTDDG